MVMLLMIQRKYKLKQERRMVVPSFISTLFMPLILHVDEIPCPCIRDYYENYNEMDRFPLQ